jgi:hypothetical protein
MLRNKSCLIYLQRSFRLTSINQLIPDLVQTSDFPTVDEFWALNREAKAKRNFFDVSKDIGPTDPIERKKIISTYDAYANISTANVFLSYFNNTLEYTVHEFIWEYRLSPIKIKGGSRPNPLSKDLDALIRKAGGVNNLTSFFADRIINTDYDYFVKEFKFLDGTNFSIKYYSANDQLNYLVVPFRCLRDLYLLRALNKATVCQKNREHDDKAKKNTTVCDLVNDFDYFNSKLSCGLAKAKKVLKSKYLP